MPRLGGAAAIKALAERGSEAKVLVLTTYDTDRDVVPGARGRRHRLPAQGRSPRRARPRHPRRGPRRIGPGAIRRDAARQPAPLTGARGAERPRARGPDADRPGRDQRRRGGAPLHLGGDRQDAPAPHLRQARRQRPRRGRRDRLRARPPRPPPRLAGRYESTRSATWRANPPPGTREIDFRGVSPAATCHERISS